MHIKIFRLFLMVLVLFAFNGCYSTSKMRNIDQSKVPLDNRMTVAVVDFANQTGDKSYDQLIGSVTGNMIDELQKTKAYRLIERQRLDTVLGELKLSMSGLMDSEKAKQVGKQLGVDAFIFGNLASVKYSRSKQSILIMWTEGQQNEVSMDARLVKVETGEIVSSAKANAYVKQRTWVAFWFAKLGRVIEKNSIIQTGIELCVRDLAVSLAEGN